MTTLTIENVKNHYLAFELSAASRAKLLQLFPAKFSRVIAHHVTIAFNPTEQTLQLVKDHLSAEVVVYGEAEIDGVQCVGVRFGPTSVREDGKLYHVTISVEPPHKPVESNEAMKHVQQIRGLVLLDGEFKLLPK